MDQIVDSGAEYGFVVLKKTVECSKYSGFFVTSKLCTTEGSIWDTFIKILLSHYNLM